MSRTLQLKRYASTVVANTRGAAGELIIDTTNNILTIHDGIKVGGHNSSNATNILAQAGFNKANSANILAQQSYDASNTKVSKSGDTMTGNLNFSRGGAILGNVGQNEITMTSNVIGDWTGFTAYGYGAAQIYANTFVQLIANTGVGGAEIWNFNTDGTITFPDNTIQKTAANVTPAFNKANSVNIIAQAAFDKANTAAQIVPQNAQNTDYTLISTDAGKHLYYTQSANVNLYIPWSSNASFANGTTIMIVSRTTSSANVTVTPNVGVSLYLAGNTTSASRNVITYGVASIIQVEANTWMIYGNGVI
jgi:hypothetical protein